LTPISKLRVGAHPEIDVHVAASLDLADFAQDGVDLAVLVWYVRNLFRKADPAEHDSY
jgi:hypothetical protein